MSHPQTRLSLCALIGAWALSMTPAVSQAGGEERGAGRLPLPKHIGDSRADLVYTPVTPCRIIDTRLAGGAIGAGTTRSFLVTGTDLSSQGGSGTGCNVPKGSVRQRTGGDDLRSGRHDLRFRLHD